MTELTTSLGRSGWYPRVMEFTLTFLQLVVLVLGVTAPIWLLFMLLIVVLGQIAGRLEGWPPLTTLYWSLITATTVGYGDIRPSGRLARVFAVFIARCGLILFGIVVAIVVQATTEAVRLHADLSEIRAITR